MTWLAIKTLFFENGQKIIWVVAVLIVLYGGYQIRGIMAERDEALNKNAALLKENLALTLDNERLGKANRGSVQAGEVQSYAAVAAMSRREELADIMAGPALCLGSAEFKGEMLNAEQDRLLVDFYNNLFAGLGGVRPQ